MSTSAQGPTPPPVPPPPPPPPQQQQQQQRRGAFPARGLGPERAGEGAAAAAQAPVPGRGRAGDAAAPVLEPEGQVQLHRPVSEQPAGALQRSWQNPKRCSFSSCHASNTSSLWDLLF